MKACAGVGRSACPNGKAVWGRAVRCPDCQLAHRRQEDERLMARVRTATPPATTIDGQLQRMRDRNRAAEAGGVDEADEADVAPDLEPDDQADDVDAPEPDDEDALDEVETEAPPPLAPRRIARNPGHRQQPAPRGVVTGERPWWATTTRESLTATATERAAAMSRTREGRSVTSKVLGD